MPALAIPDPYGLTASDALTVANERELWPTALGSREIAEVPGALKERAVFSARTTNARYLAEMKTRIERYLAAGYKGDKASLRVELKQELRRLGYSPLRGFPGDEELDIPPADPGSLQDLSSDRRINLILDTQLRLMTGKSQRAAGMDALAMERYPAWELIRTEGRRIPRDWPRRWKEAGGRLFAGRMIALKDSEVWDVIGDPAFFPDALAVNHPPFAFSSGMGWRQIDEEECLELGVLRSQRPLPPVKVTLPDVVPDATVSTSGMDAGVLAELKKKLGKFLETAKKITWRSIFGREEINAGKPCGKGWISDWKKCDKAARGVIAKGVSPLRDDAPDQTWEQMGLPPMKGAGVLNVAKRPALEEASVKLQSMEAVDPNGRIVRAAKQTVSHVKRKAQEGEIDRARWLNHAAAAVERPFEIWERGNRHYYLAQFKGRDRAFPFVVVASRISDSESEFVSFHKHETWHALNKEREGRLLYQTRPS